MTRDLQIGDLKCLCATTGRTDRVAYILYPMDMLEGWIESATAHFGVTIVAITGMDWQNVFSPWPAKGVPKGTPDFEGRSPEFLALLRDDVIPKVESELGLDKEVERTLVGVSMSGLFTLWQWALCDTFTNIASLSGSFWYEGFIDWFDHQRFDSKTGRAYFLLGNLESRARAFHAVGENTHIIVESLEHQGVDVMFQSVPGDHYADPIPRLNASFTALFKK
ncbi:MAG: alpha/beta hydrolase-fold protein [Lachnoclostridium sp.]|nr:alpha/beta hydrolase-fold protein [Lachnoclostridium sp.]